MQEMMKDPRWYSAMNVIVHANADTTPDTAPKKVEEMWAAAIMLTAMQEQQGRQYWLQPVSDSEGSPDVRTITRNERTDGRADDYIFQDLEIVSYTAATAATGESLPDFVLRTKLGPKKAYDHLTTILVWAKTAPPASTATEWKTVMAKAQTKVPQVMLLGHRHPTDPIYCLLQVYPEPLPLAIDYNVLDLLKKHGHTGVINLMRGTKKKEERREGEEHCPFESFGVKCSQIP
jgi:hypothetical protein